MNITREKIDLILRAEDIEGLLEQGAPIDEYTSEANAIYIALISLDSGQPTIGKIVNIISRIWANSFNLSVDDAILRQPAIRKVAESILQEGTRL